MRKDHSLLLSPEAYLRSRWELVGPCLVYLALNEVAWWLKEREWKAFRLRPNRRARTGRSLRPGPDTPLWNELQCALRPYLRRYGSQVNLGRLLGLPRQRVNGFVTRRTEMPDAERTLQLIVWLAAMRRGQPPS